MGLQSRCQLELQSSEDLTGLNGMFPRSHTWLWWEASLRSLSHGPLHRATHNIESGVPQREWFQKWEKRQRQWGHTAFYDLISKLHTITPAHTHIGRNYTRVSMTGGRDNRRSSWKLATTMTDWMSVSCLSLVYFPRRALFSSSSQNRLDFTFAKMCSGVQMQTNH